MSRNSANESSTGALVNYEEAAVAEVVIGELEYRVDAGKQGTALCVSTRPAGSWDWSFLDEVRFDGTEIRSKTIDRQIREQLTKAFRAAIQDLES